MGACQDCTRCTMSEVNKLGRVLAAVLTLLVSEICIALVDAFRRTCPTCRHPLAIHSGARVHLMNPPSGNVVIAGQGGSTTVQVPVQVSTSVSQVNVHGDVGTEPGPVMDQESSIQATVQVPEPRRSSTASLAGWVIGALLVGIVGIALIVGPVAALLATAVAGVWIFALVRGARPRSR